MNLSRSLPWLIAAAALAGALGLHLGQRYFAPDGAPDAATRTALVYPQPRALDDFLLERSDGRPLTLADWRGHWSVVFIGFTHCPDVCPQTLAVMRDIERAWPEQAGALPGLYFVSVDPERDDAGTLADYAGYFSKSIVPVRGGHDRLLPFTRQLGMIYMRTPPEGETYTVDHSTHLAVVDPQARLVALFRAPLDAGAIVADLVALQADGTARGGN
jgi:protein SCO1/2